MKCQDVFTLGKLSENIECHLLQILFAASKVNTNKLPRLCKVGPHGHDCF